MNGTITAPEKAIVYGSLDGEVTAREVLIGPNGRIAGRLTAAVVDIHGDGPDELTAWQSLTVRATGRLSGTIHYARLEVEPGGIVDGELIPIDAASASPGLAPGGAVAAILGDQ